jgi:3-hydroxyacyl-CoA dehydrogenase
MPIYIEQFRFHDFERNGDLTMADGNQSIMEKAEARFVDKQKKTAERNKATAEYMSEAKARIIKTARLRELRLAKEEADRVAEALNPTPKKKRVVKKVAATEVKS